jgi:hypothetical protein
VLTKGITGSRSRPRGRGPRLSAARATSRSSRPATADAYANADRPQLLIGPPRLSGSGRRTVTLSSNRYGCARMTPARRRCNQDISARTMFSSSPATASRRGSGPRATSQNSESRRRRSSSAASIAGCAPLARDPRQGCADAVRIRRSGPGAGPASSCRSSWPRTRRPSPAHSGGGTAPPLPQAQVRTTDSSPAIVPHITFSSHSSTRACSAAARRPHQAAPIASLMAAITA